MAQGKQDLRQPNAIDAHVGRRIRLLRKAKGLSQTAVANRIGVTFQQIQKYENGRNRVSSSKLLAIAEVLGVQAAFFFQGEPDQFIENLAFPPASNSTMIEFMDTAEAVVLNRAFAQIGDANVRRKILNLLKSLVDEPPDCMLN